MRCRPDGNRWQVRAARAPNSKTAYDGSSVIPIRTATSTALKPINVGSSLSNIAIPSNGKTAYVSQDRFTGQGHALRGFVIPIRTATNTTFTPIKVGYGPRPIAITP